MSINAVDRALAMLEQLAAHPAGLPLSGIAEALAIPKSAAHRLLASLAERRYVRQDAETGRYLLTTRLVSLGFRYLALAGVSDIVQPTLDRLAHETGELVRLGIIDGDRQTWVAKAQGARSGLRYDPDMGIDVKLSCTSSGHAWMATLPEDDAITLLTRQGLGLPPEYGPNAPTSVAAVMKCVRQAKKQGYAITLQTYAPMLSAISAPILVPGKGAVGVLAISGPMVRLTEEKMRALAPELLAAAADIASASTASALFNRAFARAPAP